MDNERRTDLSCKCTHLFWRQPLRRSLSVLGILLALALACTLGRAQATQGAIAGSVKNAADAAVPGATVTLTNTDENTARKTNTNSAGAYSFADVKAAHYTVKVAAPSFNTWVMSGITLTVRQELRVDASLVAGDPHQITHVSADSLGAIETTGATISGHFNAAQVTQLPVNTRASFTGTSAAGILGEMSSMQADSSGNSLQGALPYQTDVIVDGVTVKNTTGSVGGIAGSGYVINDSFPSSDSIGAMRADGVLVTAAYGDPGQVIITTKAGGNQLHGAGFWYYQNSAFDAIAYTYPITTTKPSLTGNTFGGSVGGPVVIPHFYNGHNKTFFFGTYEGWRHPAQTTVTEKVPSTPMKTGDFSNYTTSGGGAVTLNDPYTNTSWGTSIPTGSLNTIAKSVLSQFYPDPTVTPTLYTDNGVPNYVMNKDSSAHSNQVDVRGDQYFGANQKFLLWGKYSQKNFPSNNVQVLNVPSSQSLSNNKAMKVDTNWSITPHLINEGGYGFQRYVSGQSNSFNGNAWTTAQGWVGLQNLYYNGIPYMGFNNIQSLNSERLTGLNKSDIYDYSDVLMWNKGNHNFKFGGEVQTLSAVTPLTFNDADNYGSYQFNTSASAGMFTGVDFGDFLLGLPNQTFYDVVKQDNYGVAAIYSFFAQDEWRVSPRLVLSYGIRYELHPPYYDKYGDIGNFDPTVPLAGKVIYPDGDQSLLAQGFLASANACDPDGVTATNSATVNGAPCMQVVNNSAAGLDSGLKMFPHKRFMPRFGFAYRPFSSDKWAIRGGFGLYNITLMGTNFYSLTGTVQAYTQNFSNTFSSPGHFGYQWPNIYAGSGGSTSPAYGTDYFGTANGINWKDPYSEQWSLGIDHDFGSGYAARISYVGDETHQLVWAPDWNTLPFSSTVSAYNQPMSARAFPNWGRVNTRNTGANESYQSLQAEASHRLQKGMEFHTVFTWAKALADNQGPSGTAFAGEQGGSRSSSILDRHADFGNVYGTRRLRWSANALYDLPFGRGKTFGSFISRKADMAVGGWRLSAILVMQTGPFETPFFPNGQGDPSGTGSGLNSALAGWDAGHRSQRPDRVSGVSVYPATKNRYHWANPAAFTCPGNSAWAVNTPCTTGSGSGPVPLPIGRFGNSQVGTLEGPGLFNLSAGLSKYFQLSSRVKVKAEGTFTNVLNHTNLSDPNMDLSSASYGLVTNTIGSDSGGARTGQISFRAEF
jgi:hypothetical protein